MNDQLPNPTPPPIAATPAPAPGPVLHVPTAPTARRKSTKAKDTTVALYLRVPQSVARNLKFAAVAEDATMSDIVARLLEQHLGNWVAPHRRAG